MCIQVSESPVTLSGAPCAVGAIGCSLVSLVVNPALQQLYTKHLLLQH